MTWWQILKQVWEFAVQEHKWWFLFLVTLLVGVASFVALSEASLVAPFLYPLF